MMHSSSVFHCSDLLLRHGRDLSTFLHSLVPSLLAYIYHYTQATNSSHHVIFLFTFSIHFIWITTFKYLYKIKHFWNMICNFWCSNYISVSRIIYLIYHQTIKRLHWLKNRLIYNTGRKMMINEFWKRKGSIC